MRTLILLAALLAASSAAADGRTFEVLDIPEIEDASQNNEARFIQDFRGNRIFGDIVFTGVERSVMGPEFIIRLGSNGFLHDAECETTDSALLDRLARKQVGEIVRVWCTIRSTFMGVLELTDCEIR